MLDGRFVAQMLVQSRGVGMGGQGGQPEPLDRQLSYFDHIDAQNFGLRPPLENPKYTPLTYSRKFLRRP